MHETGTMGSSIPIRRVTNRKRQPTIASPDLLPEERDEDIATPADPYRRLPADSPLRPAVYRYFLEALLHTPNPSTTKKGETPSKPIKRAVRSSSYSKSPPCAR